ncbi:MAG: ribonuclease HII [Candidatus Nealsonbacteria bacterium]
MKYPNFREEKRLRKKGYICIAGIDEVGRGPMAGPVLAVALIVNIKKEQVPCKQEQKSKRNKLLASKSKMTNQKLKFLNFKEIKDSKKLSVKKREEIFDILKKMPEIEWGIGKVSEKIIDKINILEATKLAMKRAVNNLQKKTDLVDFLLIDGNIGLDLDIAQKSMIKGDEKVISCALASIIAKVSRDKIMISYHKKYPEYGFDKHKGYGTDFHFKMMEIYGSSVIHRKSFNFKRKDDKII